MRPPSLKFIKNKKSSIRGHSSSSRLKNHGLDVSNISFEYIYGLEVEDLSKQLDYLHENLFKASSVNLSGNAPKDSKMKEETRETKYSKKKKYEFRNPELGDDVKYIKEPQPFGNPFKLIIRPKNQSIKMNEIEDEAFNTAISDKKKPSKLESYASIYKQKMKKGVKGIFF